MRWMPLSRSLVLRTVKPPLWSATTSEPATASKLSANAKPTSWSGSAGPNWAVIAGRHPLEAARVHEVDRGVGPARGVVDALELVEVDVVDEALGHQDQRLPAPGRGQAVERALDHVERRAQARGGLEVHVGGAARVTIGSSAVPARHLVRAAVAAHLGVRDAVGVVAPQHARHHFGIAVDLDPHRLVVRHALGAHVRDQPPVERLHHLDQLGAAGLHARRPPGSAGGRDQRDAVALASALLEEARDRHLRLVGARRRDVHVVEHHHEGASALRLGRHVGRDLGRRRRGRRRLLGQLDRLEAHDVLLHAVLGDRHVCGGQPADRHALLVGDHRRPRSPARAGREAGRTGGRRLRRAPGRCGPRGRFAARPEWVWASGATFSWAQSATAKARLSSAGTSSRLFIVSFHLHVDASVLHLHVVALDLERRVDHVLARS